MTLHAEKIRWEGASESNARTLLEAIETARARARGAGRPAFLRVTFGLSSVDPWRLLPPAYASGEPIFAWHDGRRGFVALTIGETEARAFRGAERFTTAQQTLDAWRPLAVTVDRSPAPTLDALPFTVGGMSFSADRSPDEGWAPWPAGLLRVPRLVLCKRLTPVEQGGTTLAALQVSVPADEEPSDLAERIEGDLARIEHEAATATTPRTFVPPAAAVSRLALLEDESSWRARVQAARRAFAAGTLTKVVLARAAELTAAAGWRFDPVTTLMGLRQRHPQSITFALTAKGGGSFVGATPEVLVTTRGIQLETHALAGTVGRSAPAPKDAALGMALLASDKDRAEHGAVVEFLRQTLAPCCRALTIEDEPHLLRLPNVQHLETAVAGTLREPGQILRLLERLHPTPSVGGWPTGAAQRWLREHEPIDRGWYAGPVGFVTAQGDGAFAVAIRSALLTPRVARAYAGAGIVAGSEPAVEWRETELKLRTMQEALRLSPEPS